MLKISSCLSKLIVGAVLSLALLITPAHAYSPSEEDTGTAYAIAISVYQSYLSYLIVPPLPQIVQGPIFPFVAGSYGLGCNNAGLSRQDYSCYNDPEYQKTILIYIDSDALRSRGEYLFVLAHEMGHHILLHSGMHIWEHHEFMNSGPDQEICNILKIQCW